MEKSGINIYDAIAQMREITKRGEEFSVAFMSCDTTREKSSGLVEVPRMRLRSGAGDDVFKNSQFIVNYLNLDTNIPGRFYQILLMYFNGKKVEL